jgi:thioredoxin 1
VTATYIQEADFDQLLTSPELVVIDCTLIAPLIDQLAVEYEGRAKVVKLDIDANKGLSKRLGIRSIPNVFIFKQGEKVESIVGKAAYEVFSSAVEKHL